MLTEKQLERYADVLLWGLKTARTNPFKKGDMVVIRYNLPAVRLAEIIYARLFETGINPIHRMSPTPAMEKAFYALSNNKQLDFIAPGEEELCRHLNGSIFLYAPESITHLSGIDPKKIGRAAVARKHLRDILDKRDEQGDFGWTLCMLPTTDLARHAGLTMADYTGQIVKACFLNRQEPVAHWQRIYKEINAIKKWLGTLDVKTFHIESDSMDLEITPGRHRKWAGLSGHNIPSFEVFISPDWRGTKGVYHADQPSFRSGNYVRGVLLEFKRGKVVHISAAEGENFVKKQLSMDPGACRLGEFSLTDKRFSRINHFMANTLFDENFGGKHGNCHIAVGSSYSDTFSGDLKKLTKQMKKELGFNDSALHWDLVNTEKKRVWAHLASGEKIVVYENGCFKKPAS